MNDTQLEMLMTALGNLNKTLDAINETLETKL